jgi:hypothetical protein
MQSKQDFVILSAAKNLFFVGAGCKQVLRFA